MHRCSSRARVHIQTHTWKARTVQTLSVPTSNLDLPSKATPFHLEYLRCKQTNAPLGEGVRQAEGKWWRQTDQNRHRMRRGRSKQASRWCEVDEEEDAMTGTQPARNGKEQNTFLIRLFFDGSCFKGKFACVWWYTRLSLHFTPSSRFFCGFSFSYRSFIFSNPLLWQIIPPSFFIIFFSPSLSPSQSALCLCHNNFYSLHLAHLLLKPSLPPHFRTVNVNKQGVSSRNWILVGWFARFLPTVLVY